MRGAGRSNFEGESGIAGEQTAAFGSAFSDMGTFYVDHPEAQRRSSIAGYQRDLLAFHAYSESRILRKFHPHLRGHWSACRVKTLAEVIGPWRRYDVFNIDLPSLLKVDEWLECEAQLSARAGKRTDTEKAAIKADAEWIEDSLSDGPASTIFGVIAKLMIWRRKNATYLARNPAFARRHRLAYAAYADLIRLTGLLALAIKDDEEFSAYPLS